MTKRNDLSESSLATKQKKLQHIKIGESSKPTEEVVPEQPAQSVPCKKGTKKQNETVEIKRKI